MLFTAFIKTVLKGATATSGDILKGKKVFLDDPNILVEGMLELTGTLTSADLLKNVTGYGSNPKTKITGSLELTGNAGTGDVLSGMTFYNTNAKAKQTGSLSLTGTAGVGDVLNGTTFYNTNAKSKQTGSLVLSGNAGPANVLSGYTFYNTNAKSKQTGTYTPNLTSNGSTYTQGVAESWIDSGAVRKKISITGAVAGRGKNTELMRCSILGSADNVNWVELATRVDGFSYLGTLLMVLTVTLNSNSTYRYFKTTKDGADEVTTGISITYVNNY